MESVTLNDGVRMPKLGCGVYQVDPAECERCVPDAISVGYRSIDTAQAYNNEEGVGAAIAKCGVPREELFITTKVWISNAGYEKARASIEQSPRRLGAGYIDLLLIHQPFNDYYRAYRAMEEAYKAGRIRAIGVSNFYPDRLTDLCQFVEVALRFLLQSDVAVIPKSTHKERMAQSFEIFDFALSDEDVETIRRLDEGESLFFSHFDPAMVEFLTELGK